MDKRAVSDVIGFILIFSLISLAVGIVSLSGFAGLQDRQDAEQVNNAERAFEILANNVEDIYRRSAPRRATEIELAGARLSSGERTTVAVTITNLDQNTYPPNVKVLHPIRYTAPDGTTLVYENGAVIREDPSGEAVMKREPNLVFSSSGGTETAVLPIVATSAASSIGGETTALIRTQSQGTAVLDRYDDPTADGLPTGTQYELQLRITTSPERAEAWQSSLQEEITAAYGPLDTGEGCTRPTSTAVECTVRVDQVSITSTRVDVGFD
jgi:type II secretory pathway pseudopilin PulG